MRNVNVSKSSKPFVIRRHWPQRGHRNLNVDDRFRAEPGNRSRAIMVDAQREWSKCSPKTISLGVEGSRPIRIIGHYFKLVLARLQSRLSPALPNVRNNRAGTQRWYTQVDDGREANLHSGSMSCR